MASNQAGIGLGIAAIMAALVLTGTRSPASAQPASRGRCTLQWSSSSGSIHIMRNVSQDGEATDHIYLSMQVPSGSTLFNRLNLVEWRGKNVDPIIRKERFAISFDQPYGWPDYVRVVMQVNGRPLEFLANRHWGELPLEPDQLAALLSNRGLIAYTVYDNHKRKGRILTSGQFDLSGFGSLGTRGFTAMVSAATQALDQTQHQQNPPCNTEEITRELAINCSQSWTGPMGDFSMVPGKAEWTYRPFPGALLKGRFGFLDSANSDAVRFLDDGDARSGFNLALVGDDFRWQRNRLAPDEPRVYLQASEIRAGELMLREWLPAGLADRDPPLRAQTLRAIVAASGPLKLTVYDVETQAALFGELAAGWQGRLMAQLRAGHARLRAAEADPMAQCKVEVLEHRNVDAEIVI